jgi:hypothetical protein
MPNIRKRCGFGRLQYPCVWSLNNTSHTGDCVGFWELFPGIVAVSLAIGIHLSGSEVNSA